MHVSRHPLGRATLSSLFAVAALAASAASLARCTSPEPRPTAPPSESRTRTSDTLDEARRVESDIIAGVDRVRPATVCLVFEGEEEMRRGTGSGVIVGDDGSKALVLTCGHMTRKAGRACTIILPDGRVFAGESVAAHEDATFDLGLVEFETTGETLPVAEISEEMPAAGDWVVVLGHPRGLWLDLLDDEELGRSSGDGDTGAPVMPRWRSDAAGPSRDPDGTLLARAVRPPVVRAGRIWTEPSAAAGLRFDAPLEAGDSGGPVIDRSGRIVAIASRCGWKSFWNWGSSVAMLEGDPARLLDEALEIPEGDSDPGAGAADPTIPARSRDAPPRLAAFGAIAAPYERVVAVVEDDDGPRAFALAVGADGLFVTKGSEAGFAAPLTVTQRGRRSTAARLAYDADADLMLLRAASLDTAPVLRRRSDEPPAGALLLNVGASGEILSSGTMALEPSQLEHAGGAPFLGVGWRPDGTGAARISGVMPGTPAARAGVRIGDRVVAVDGRELDASRSLGDEILGRRMGDVMRLTISRLGDETPRTVVVTLDRRQPSLRQRDRGNTRSSTSRVLPHRTHVWHQDGVVDPEQCGSAVIDLDGRLVGMNAGRFDRTSTIVIPIGELERRVEAMLRRSADDPQSFDELADATFAATESAGRVRLPTVDARFVGPRKLARVIGNALTPDGGGITIMADDRLRWDAIIDAPGRFEVIFSGVLHAPRDVRLAIGDAVVETTIPEGRPRRGVSIGEIDVRTVGRVPITFEWLRADDDDVPGSMRFIELRRVRTHDGAVESAALAELTAPAAMSCNEVAAGAGPAIGSARSSRLTRASSCRYR